MAHNIDVELPFQFEDFYVLSFGKITASPPYYGVDYIYPIGYKSCWHEKITGSLFTCQVSDNGHGGPVFIIKRSSCSKSPIPCGQTVLCRADNTVVSNLPETISGSTSNNPVYKDVIGSTVVSKLPEIISGSSSNNNLVYKDVIVSKLPEINSGSSTNNLVYEDVIVSKLPEINPGSSSNNLFFKDVIGDTVVSKLPEIISGSSSNNNPVYKDVIGDLCFEGSSLSLTWNVMLEKISDVYEEIIRRDCSVPCYCGHATDSTCQVSVPGVVRGEKECCEFLEMLMGFLRGYGFGLDVGFVQEFIEKLPEAGGCLGYVLCKDRVLDSSLMILNKKVKIKEREPFPVGSLISSRLSSHAIGDLLQVHEFLCRFQEILEVEEDCLSYEDLENELLSPWPVTYGLGGGAFLETLEMNSIKPKVDKLTSVHLALLPKLVRKLMKKIAIAFNITSDAKDAKKNKGKKVKLEMFPINSLTWPEVARRYILACLLMGGKVNSLETPVGNNTKLIRCLQGDDGIFTGSPAGVAGADVDAQLIGRAVEKVFGKLIKERGLPTTGTKVDNSDKFGLDTDFTIPEWAKVLDPVRKLPTNVGSRIRNCVRESLKKNPPEWAKKLLEASITKEVYKGNASGPTKRAVIDVLKKVSEGPQTALPPGGHEIKRSKMFSDAVMKKCRVVLRQVAARDRKKIVSDLVGRSYSCDENIIKFVFGSVTWRPVDLRSIDLRLVNGAYGGSHEAFLEDVREVWINLRRTYMNRPSVIKLVDEMSSDFKLLYEKEVAILFRRFYEQNMNGKPIEEIEKELEDLLNSTEIPKVPWETGICKVCGQNRDDKNVLLCDTVGCNAEYHTYCLTPPLSEIPEGDWFCPSCVPPKWDNDPDCLQNVLQFVDENCEETVRFLEIVTDLKEKEYCELDADKKTFMLKFLCDELLKTSPFRTYIKPPKATQHNMTQQKKSLKYKEQKTIAKNDNDSLKNHPTNDPSSLDLRKEYLGTDSDNRFYWGFPKNKTTHHGILVNEGKNGNSGAWHLFQSDEQIKNLLDYIKRNHPNRRELRDSISNWKKSTSTSGQTKGETVISRNGPATNASVSSRNLEVVNEGKNGNSEIKNLANYLDRNDPNRKELRNSISNWKKSTSTSGQTKGKTVISHNLEVDNEGKNGNSGARHLFQSNEQMKNLVNYVEKTDPNRKESRNSLSSWKKSTLDISQTKGETVFSLATNASILLDAKYNNNSDSIKKPRRRKNMGKWERCCCMEPVLPCRYHCVKCHETFLTNVEFEKHKNFCHVDLVVSNDGGAPEFFVGSGCGEVLRRLKICLLDMEAALPDGAKRGSRAGSEWRSEWCRFVKSANTILEMVEATIVLETMIKTDFIKNTWWWYWSSVAAAAKTSTISALALRIYTLDAAIDYQKTTAAATTTTTTSKQSNKRKHVGDKVKVVRKKPKKVEDKQEIKEQVQNIVS